MNRARRGWLALLASACLCTGAAGCHDLFNLDEHPQTFVDPASYFELVRRYGAVPLRLTPYVPDGTYGDAARVPIEQVYPVIVADWKAATQELPRDFASHTYSSADRGRPTAFSAWGLLAKVYLTMAGAELAGTPLAGAKQQYDDSARLAAQQVMQSGWVALEPSYMRLFDGQQQINSNEILFQIGATHQENTGPRSEEHTSELQSQSNLVCRLLLE